MTPKEERLKQLSEWAPKIDALTKDPLVRALLRKLIKPPFPAVSDDPCDILMYRVPGTRLVKYQTPEDLLPELGNEQEERQRQAIMLVAIRDIFCQVKISAGIWQPELFDRVAEKMKSYPPDGPSSDAVTEAMNWLEAENESDPQQPGRKPNAQGPVGETGGKAKETREHGASKEQPWNDRHSDYMGASEAVQMAEKLNRRISLPTLSRLVRKPDCPIRFMRKSNGVRVHIADFKAHLETRPKIKPTGEDIGDEALDEYMADARATQAAMRHRKAGTEPED
jgi:hypothetical protein